MERRKWLMHQGKRMVPKAGFELAHPGWPVDPIFNGALLVSLSLRQPRRFSVSSSNHFKFIQSGFQGTIE